MTGKRIANRLTDYKDGALQLILKELTCTDLVRALYVIPEEGGERILLNISSYSVPIIKGQCILNKDSVSPSEIRESVKKLEESIDDYSGDPKLEAGYKD